MDELSITLDLLQKLILVEKGTWTIRLCGSAATQIRVIACPEDIWVKEPPALADRGWMLTAACGERRTAYRSLTVEIFCGEERVIQEIPTRIFGEKEHFLCMVTTSNFHWGYNPSRVKEIERTGAPRLHHVYGDPVLCHGHAYDSSVYMAEGCHQHLAPVTWLIDADVAHTGAAQLSEWHMEYGDDVGVLPSSYFHHNPVNYNVDYTVEDTVRMLDYHREFIKRAMAGQGWLMHPQVLGVDQWVGGIGSHFLQAAKQLDFGAFWGICFDHETCDSSMYHEGAPWDAYRLSGLNFRYPSVEEGGQWAFAWTARDLVNSFLEYPGASTRYSTDPDDIAGAGIMAGQADYWTRIHQGFVNNAHNDFSCFVIHNEDHDAHKQASQDYIANYLAHLPQGVVASTLEEVRQWLDLRYPAGQHPSQLLELADPLTCHEAVSTIRHKGNPPAHWGQSEGHNPSVLCYYGKDARWMAREGERVPAQYIDYGSPNGFQETGTSPKKPVPVLLDWQEERRSVEGKEVLTVSFTSDIGFERLPVIWWDRPELVGDEGTARTAICYLDVQAGRNQWTVALRKE
ncbi:MAG: hypothetical protein K0R57_2011 [Paenibacillaceae bacterium]|jgi:hypothetical protein|nr:hypothetical protein [Paenibacillaceae bacterium]